MTVAFDGKVALCCDDFAAELNIGNLSHSSIKEVYCSKEMDKIRDQFYTQKLDLCKECSRFTKPKKEDVELIQAQIVSLEVRQQNKIKFNY